MTWTFRPSDLYLIRKEDLATALLFTGMLIAFLGSMSPWFMWPIGSHYSTLAAFFLIGAIIISNSSLKPIFNRNDFILPFAVFLLFSIYEGIFSEKNIFGFIAIVFKAVIFLCIFRLDLDKLQQLATFIAKVMGFLLALSLAGHFLYLLGFPLPGTPVQLGDFYSFTNHYLFLLDDRNLFAFVPRFNSYFPEPSHVGSSAAFLLFTQRGHWRRWYNIVLFATIFFSFSLAAYVYLTTIIFLNLWIKRKAMFRKLAITIAFFIAAITVAFTYNGGENLVHDLILLRLEVEDGELAGDNRVTQVFETDFDNYLSSSDIVFGRTFVNDVFGNSGFKVFFRFEYLNSNRSNTFILFFF
ncbi:MAG: hypothetical protein J5610_05270 [Prevotella sp.]|nr:hypothetical protein [Prevotella sp.]